MSNKLAQFNIYKHEKSTLITRGLLTPIIYLDKVYKQLTFTNPSENNCETITINLNLIHQTVRFVYLPLHLALRVAEIEMNVLIWAKRLYKCVLMLICIYRRCTISRTITRAKSFGFNLVFNKYTQID